MMKYKLEKGLSLLLPPRRRRHHHHQSLSKVRTPINNIKLLSIRYIRCEAPYTYARVRAQACVHAPAHAYMRALATGNPVSKTSRQIQFSRC